MRARAPGRGRPRSRPNLSAEADPGTDGLRGLVRGVRSSRAPRARGRPGTSSSAQSSSPPRSSASRRRPRIRWTRTTADEVPISRATSATGRSAWYRRNTAARWPGERVRIASIEPRNRVGDISHRRCSAELPSSEAERDPVEVRLERADAGCPLERPSERFRDDIVRELPAASGVGEHRPPESRSGLPVELIECLLLVHPHPYRAPGCPGCEHTSQISRGRSGERSESLRRLAL